MALTPQNTDAFLREVSEEVQRDRIAAMTRRYGAIVAGIVVLALVALAGVLIWRGHQATVAGEQGEQFTAAMSALSAGDSAKAKISLDPILKDDPKGYGPLAHVLQADMLVQQGKDKEAVAAFQALADDGTVPQTLRDLATVRAASLGFDMLPAQEVINRLKPLAVAGNPWFGTAGEISGIAYMKLNQPAKAGPLFAAVAKDKTVPQSIRQRTVQLAADLGIEVVQPADSAQP